MKIYRNLLADLYARRRSAELGRKSVPLSRNRGRAPGFERSFSRRCRSSRRRRSAEVGRIRLGDGGRTRPRPPDGDGVLPRGCEPAELGRARRPIKLSLPAEDGRRLLTDTGRRCWPMPVDCGLPPGVGKSARWEDAELGRPRKPPGETPRTLGEPGRA